VVAAKLSAQVLGLLGSEVERIDRLFQRAGLPTQLNLSAVDKRKVLLAMQLDKKVSAGQIKFVLARRIGAVEFDHEVPAGLLAEAINHQPSTIH
jgi:3-dehydroquinate synthetase